MRLICPNCGAQYEVDAKVIPNAGRDVQCSNCGHTWFQRAPETDSDLAQEMGFELTSDDAMSDTPVAAMHNTAPAPSEPDFGDDDDPAFDDDIAEHGAATSVDPDTQDSDTQDEMPATAAPSQRSAVSESVRDILRAEVAHDHAVRQPEPDLLETQSELGLGDAPTKDQKQGLRERMARLRGLNPSAQDVAMPGKRRDLLPDIEEINSTLSAASERDADGSVIDDETRKDRARKSGFRMTFSVLILIVVLLVLLYILSPFLAQKIPALDGVLNGYVTGVNGFRSWLDATITSASASLNALLGQLNGDV